MSSARILGPIEAGPSRTGSVAQATVAVRVRAAGPSAAAGRCAEAKLWRHPRRCIATPLLPVSSPEAPDRYGRDGR
ncbi:hypothetical protein MTO96_028820 [Rhipicephalus appendiculatus]